METEVGTQFIALANDRVLAIGGSPTGDLALSDAADVYDARTNTWDASTPIPEARMEPALITLRSGMVMVIGGAGARGQALKSAYLFDPEHQTWIRAADMSVARSAPTAVMLHDGRVLVLGGAAAWSRPLPAPDDISDVEIFDPAANSWTPTAPLPMGGVLRPSAIVLQDGRVLVAGGSVKNSTIASAALFDPAHESWRTLPNLPQPRSDGVMVLGPGKVVLMGGVALAGSPEGGGFTINPALDSEFFDSRTLSWSLGSPPTSQRANNFLSFWAGVAPLHDGRMLALGVQPALAYTYDASADFWQVAGSPPPFQTGVDLVVMSDGRVLAISTKPVWIYDPTLSPPAPGGANGWMDSASTTLVLVAVALLITLVGVWRRLT
ncbi:MAG TPA: hypothetical protein VNA65_04655 [Candidatus Dormibacteraeota bacterium]|nr:hypothetical protein [Candidatus Dormibacteraeota bacterium]